jgi:hypothetical protein
MLNYLRVGFQSERFLPVRCINHTSCNNRALDEEFIVELVADDAELLAAYNEAQFRSWLLSHVNRPTEQSRSRGGVFRCPQVCCELKKKKKKKKNEKQKTDPDLGLLCYSGGLLVCVSLLADRERQYHLHVALPRVQRADVRSVLERGTPGHFLRRVAGQQDSRSTRVVVDCEGSQQ